MPPQKAAVAIGCLAQTGLFPSSKRGRSHEVSAHLKGAIAGKQEGQQFGRSRMTARPLDDGAKPGGFLLRETQLDDGSGNVPADVLMSDQVMGCAVIQRVGLDEAVAANQPLPCMHPVVGPDPAYIAIQIVWMRQGLVQDRSCLVS